MGVFPIEEAKTKCQQYSSYTLALGSLALNEREERIDNDDDGHEVEHIECHTVGSLYTLDGELIGEICKGESVLMECHPEEDNHSKDEAKCYNTCLGIFR